MTLSHLQRLESESIYVLHDAMAECDRPVMLYSIGKDSSVMLHLARKAFFPAPPIRLAPRRPRRLRARAPSFRAPMR
jgi:3'-phosphoadenosine 5'-phosphosulfate sulfotransferase (PAPS reductase)/FAD synthetase